MRWNGSTWVALGGGVDGVVRSLAMVGTTLIVGGEFTSAGGVAVRNLAAWDTVGESWADIDGGVGGTVIAPGGGAYDNAGVYVLESDGGSGIWIGGNFATAGSGDIAANGIARWNGAVWSAIDDGAGGIGLDGICYGIERVGADLYVGGSFTTVMASAQNRVARITPGSPSTVAALDGGANATVYAVRHDAANSRILVGGAFTQVGSGPVVTTALARWDIGGSAWAGYGAALAGGSVLAIDPADGTSATIIVGGTFSSANGSSNGKLVARYDGSAWSTFGGGLGPSFATDPEFPGGVYAIDFAADQSPIVAGNFLVGFASGSTSQTANPTVGTIATFAGSAWSGYGSSQIGTTGTTPIIDGIGNLYLGFNGPSTTVAPTLRGVTYPTVISNGTRTIGFFRWNGSAWTAVALPAGTTAITNACTSTLDGVIYLPLLVSGSSAMWSYDGTTWTQLGGAFTGVTPRGAIHVGGRLVVSGNFTAIGGDTSLAYVASWNGTSWTGHGAGYAATTYNQSMRIHVKGDDLFMCANNAPTFTQAADTGRIYVLEDWLTAPTGAWQQLASNTSRGGINWIVETSDGQMWSTGYFDALTPAGGASVPCGMIARIDYDPLVPTLDIIPGATEGVLNPNEGQSITAVGTGVIVTGYISGVSVANGVLRGLTYCDGLNYWPLGYGPDLPTTSRLFNPTVHNGILYLISDTVAIGHRTMPVLASCDLRQDAPTVSGPASPLADSTPTWTWVSNGYGNGTYRVKLDDDDLTTGSTNPGGTTYTPPPIPNGTHTLYVEEQHTNVGWWSQTGSFAVTVSIAVPNPPVISVIATTSDNTPTWTWVAGGGGNGTFRCKLDDADLSSGTTTTTSLDFTPGSPLSPGNHTLYVQERDVAGNWSASGSAMVLVLWPPRHRGNPGVGIPIF